MMRNFLIVVEGAHDAAVLGKIVQRLGYKRVQKQAQVPEFWADLIPKKYPFAESGQLDRIAVFPDFFISGSDTLAVSIAGSKSNLITTARIPIEMNGLESLAGFAVLVDSDWEVEPIEEFSRFCDRLKAWNQEAINDGLQGFPLPVPAKPGISDVEGRKIGIYMVPSDGERGALESVLLQCAQQTYPFAFETLRVALEDIRAQKIDSFKEADTESGRQKSHCGMIANLLKPGASLAVSLRQSDWVPKGDHGNPHLAALEAFVATFLA